MTITDYALLWTAISGINLLTILALMRKFDGEKPEDHELNEWLAMSLVSVIFILGWALIIALISEPVAKFLVKERTFKKENDDESDDIKTHNVN